MAAGARAYSVHTLDLSGVVQTLGGGSGAADATTGAATTWLEVGDGGATAGAAGTAAGGALQPPHRNANAAP